MRRAVISDIHGNLEALEVVLADIQAQGITEIFCLGDIIGYGPNPWECIDRVMENCTVTLLGNHEQNLILDRNGSLSGATWTRAELESPTDRIFRMRRWEFLRQLPHSYRFDSYLFVHASPRNPLSEYIFPEDISNPRKMEHLFQLVGRYCFQGHTHIPGIFTDDLQFFRPDQIDLEYNLGGGKLLINVGSVGQPRDGDNRACYLILEDGLAQHSSEHKKPGPPTFLRAPKVTYRRLPYDFETTIQKIRNR
jgi:diadenosine tetraphosphatase ApaH/serine/threonine PP2A family protein phosphatase